MNRGPAEQRRRNKGQGPGAPAGSVPADTLGSFSSFTKPDAVRWAAPRPAGADGRWLAPGPPTGLHPTLAATPLRTLTANKLNIKIP